jgi:hypothetical protein
MQFARDGEIEHRGGIIFMVFQPQANQKLAINGVMYTLCPHPMAPALPYGQEGRMATVYKVSTQKKEFALKVYNAAHRQPTIQSLSEGIRPFADLKGLEVCRREVLSPQGTRYQKLLGAEPDLAYAIIMPWIDGVTWADIIASQKSLSKKQSLALGKELIHILVMFEEQEIAHCDLSSSNLLIQDLETEPKLFLVDVEQIYGPKLTAPSMSLVGTPGYTHKFDADGLWGPAADRFAGAIILAEMLGWSSPEVRELAWETSYFNPDEIQQDSTRYKTLSKSIHKTWGKVPFELITRAWVSKEMTDCPRLWDWKVSLDQLNNKTMSAVAPVLPKPKPVVDKTPKPDQTPTLTQDQPDSESKTYQGLLTIAKIAEKNGDLEKALEKYQNALEVAEADELPTTKLIEKINALSLATVTQIVNQEQITSDQTPEASPTIPVSEYTPGGNLVKRFGGLNRSQFGFVLIGLPILSIIIMLVATPALKNTWFWNTVSTPALLVPAIYVALRRRLLSCSLFSVAVFAGGLATIGYLSSFDFEELMWLIVISGAVLLVMIFVGEKIVRDPIKNWRKDFYWFTFTGYIVALVQDIFMRSLPYSVSVNYFAFSFFNLIMGAIGWYIGNILHAAIIHLRETSQ